MALAEILGSPARKHSRPGAVDAEAAGRPSASRCRPVQTYPCQAWHTLTLPTRAQSTLPQPSASLHRQSCAPQEMGTREQRVRDFRSGSTQIGSVFPGSPEIGGIRSYQKLFVLRGSPGRADTLSLFITWPEEAPIRPTSRILASTNNRHSLILSEDYANARRSRGSSLVAALAPKALLFFHGESGGRYSATARNPPEIRTPTNLANSSGEVSAWMKL